MVNISYLSSVFKYMKKIIINTTNSSGSSEYKFEFASFNKLISDTSSYSVNQIEIRATRYYRDEDKESWICSLYSYLIDNNQNNMLSIKILKKQKRATSVGAYYDDILYLESL